ncbi:hypothetical protein [Kytococcus sp. Marseille-QA3725]
MHTTLLAYDSTCALCTETARSVEKATEGRLRVEAINSPTVQELFARAGGGYGSRPAMVRSDGSTVEVFEGARLGLELARYLGVRRTWRVLQALGSRPQADPTALPVSRKGFLAGAAGTLGAWTMLTGPAGAGPRPTFQHSRATWLQEVRITGSEELPGDRARAEMERYVRTTTASTMGAGDHFGDLGQAEVKGVLHHTDKGDFVAVSATSSSQVLALYAGTIDGQEVESTRLFEARDLDADGSPRTARLVSTSHQSEVEVTPAASCNDEECHAKGRCYSCQCVDLDLKCAVTCCGPCAFSCAAIWPCLGCMVVWCPLCAGWAAECCLGSACQRRTSPSC